MDELEKPITPNKLPSENDVAQALRYLAETDEKYAKETARVKAMEFGIKTIKAITFLEAQGTIAEKEAQAYVSQPYKAWIVDYENAVADRETTTARRKRAEFTIEVWRSLNANRRVAG